MTFRCPYCGSEQKPTIVTFLPRVIVECLDCSTRDLLKRFITNDKYVNPIQEKMST